MQTVVHGGEHAGLHQVWAFTLGPHLHWKLVQRHDPPHPGVDRTFLNPQGTSLFLYIGSSVLSQGLEFGLLKNTQ